MHSVPPKWNHVEGASYTSPWLQTHAKYTQHPQITDVVLVVYRGAPQSVSPLCILSNMSGLKGASRPIAILNERAVGFILHGPGHH